MTAFTWLPSSGRPDPQRVGGKAENLWKLSELGVRVPAFYVVTTAAYAAARAATAASGIPADVGAAVRTAAASVFSDDPFLAVRSSAVGEDAAGESFAGIHESFLYVRGEQAVLDAIERVWASASAERALAYRRSRGLPLTGAIAVVVQRMVDAVASGVAFTADPTTGDVHRVVASALWGLGEGLVSRGLDADTFVVQKPVTPTALPERTIAAKSEEVVFDAPADGGVALVPLAPERRDAPSRTDAQGLGWARATCRS